jgi:glycogen debranching enzyme
VPPTGVVGKGLEYGLWGKRLKAGRHEKAREELERLAALHGKDQWAFNEWFHGQSTQAGGMKRQAWSAGMYV